MSGWQNSDRRSRLPSDWPKRVAATKERAAGRCEGVSIHNEPRWHVTDCPGIGRECDHDRRGDDHSLTNLRWLSTECHKAKTAAERPTRSRPTSQHPGLA